MDNLLNDSHKNFINIDTAENPISRIIQSKIGKFDFVLLLGMWLLSLANSVKYLGYAGSVLFLAINVALVIKKPENGIMVLLLLFYAPAFALKIPSIFVVSSAIAIFGIVIHGKILKIFEVFNIKFIIICISFVGWALLSTLFSQNFQITLKYWIQYCHGILLLVLLLLALNSIEAYARVLKWWVIAAALSLLISTVHYFLGESTYLYEMLKNVKRANNFSAVTSMTIGIGYSEAVGRLIWPGVGPNYHSANLIFPFGVALAFFTVSRWPQKFTWLIFCIMIGCAVVGTFSRSGFISVCIVVGVFLIQNNIRAIIPMLTLSGVLAALIFLLPQLVLRVGSVGDAISRGATGRFSAWRLAFEMWFSSPIFGTGLGSYFAKHQAVAHNTFLTILCELGLIGLLLFLIPIALAILNCLWVKKLYHSTTRAESIFINTMVTALAGMCIMMATISYEEIKLFWMACGMCVSLYILVKNDASKAA